MLKMLIRTDHGITQLILRLFLGAVMFPHGAQKALGWFGGQGFAGTVDYFTQSMGLPTVLAVLIIIAEFGGAIGLILGFLTRLSALGIGSVMVGAILTVHYHYGFFMNWSGKQPGEGFEFHLLAIAIALALIINGGGALSMDRNLARGR